MSGTEKQEKQDEIVTIAKGASYVLVGTICGTGLRFLFRALIGRYLGPSLLGIYFIGLAVFRISERVSCLGIQNGILRYVPIYAGGRDEKRLKGTIVFGLRIVGLTGICVAAISFLGSHFIAKNIYGSPELTLVLRAFSVAIPFSAITTILVFSTQAFKIMKYKVMVREVLEPLLTVLIFLVLFSLSWELKGALLAFLLSVLAGTFLAYFFLKKIYPPIGKKDFPYIFEAKKLFRFSFPLFFVGFFYLIILWMNTFLIGYFLTPEDVGIFGAAHNIALLGLVVVNAFVSIFAPVVSDLSTRGQNKKLEELYKIITKWIFTLGFPLFVLMIYFDKEILVLSFGKAFVDGALVLVVLSIAMLINSVLGSAGFLTSMSGKPKLELLNLCITILVNALLSILLIPEFGIKGAAYATLIAFVLLNFMRVLEVHILFRMHPFRMDMYKPLLSGVISFIVLVFVTKILFIDHDVFFNFFLGSLIFIGLYAAMIIALGLGVEDKLIFSRIGGK